MEHKSIASERGTTHYWIHKNADDKAKCIVFTHGLTADHSMFEKQVAHFEARYTIITWDVPLHGLSRPYVDFSYSNTAVELKTILDAEHISKAVLVGMSMGGYPCQEFAAQYPDRTLALIAIDTTPFGTEYYSKSDQWWIKRAGTMAGWFPDSLLRKSMAKAVSRTQYAYDLMLSMLKPLSKADIMRQMDIAYGKFLEENHDIRLNCPVLILVGEYDTTGKVKKYSGEWAKREGYPLIVIKNATHFSNADNFLDVNAAIDAFLSQILPE